MHSKSKLLNALSIFVVLTTLLSSVYLPTASAQRSDGIQRDYNAESGKVTRITGQDSEPIVLMGAMSSDMTSTERSDVLVERFAPEFGLVEPTEELVAADESQPEPDRVVMKYQQVYEGVPVMAGELIVNASDKGALYSMNGEVAQGLSLDTQPAFSVETAIDIAKLGMVKWYGGEKADYQHSDASLQIFDESLLQPSDRPVELVWKMEMSPVDAGQPIRELVLVSAKTGNIPLHFNQVDTAWHDTKAEPIVEAQDEEPPTETPTPEPTEHPVEPQVPALESTPMPVDTPLAIEPTPTGEHSSGTSTDGEVAALANSWYVDAATGNDANPCSLSTPCQSIQRAIIVANSGDTIYVAEGIYYRPSILGANVVVINKDIMLSGGWTNHFSIQTGASVIDGQGVYNGIYVQTGGNTVIDRFIIRNATAHDGGGIYVYGFNLTIRNSSIVNNHAEARGGGIFITNYSNINIINSTISSNSASDDGGGIYVQSGHVMIEFSTIAQNSSETGNVGGVFGGNGTLNLHNSILTDNSGANSPNCNKLNESDYNLFGTTEGCAVVTGANDQVNVNPMISPTLLGVITAHYLLETSPAIDAANSSSCAANTAGVDQRGLTRPQAGGCDIGAIEYATSGAASIRMVAGTMQGADSGRPFDANLSVYVSDINENPVAGVTVTFTAPNSGPSGIFADSGTYTTTAITDAAGIAVAPVLIANSNHGAYFVVASAPSSSGNVSFHLYNTKTWYVTTTGSNSNTCSSPLAPCETIDGAILKAGTLDTIRVAAGVYQNPVSNYVLTVSKSVILTGGWDIAFTNQTDQTVIDGQKARSGIKVETGVSTLISKMIIRDGYASQGAGIYNNGNLTLSDVAVIYNTSYNDGGGIYQMSGELDLENVTISNNVAKAAGGAISINDGVIHINNSTITHNIATSGSEPTLGGGISNHLDRVVTLSNSIIAGNIADSIPDCRGKFKSNGHNLIGLNDGCILTNDPSDQLGIIGATLDVRLGNLLDNGGHTLTHALLPDSPALNAGDPITCASEDQRGVSRLSDSNCDSGAYEGSDDQTVHPVIQTYTAGNAEFLPGTIVCDYSDPSCTAGDLKAQSVHIYTAGTYQLYLMKHNRNGIDNNNMPIVSTVHFASGYYNASWVGAQVVYGDGYGFAYADDVVAHELTHGVTQYESDLYYFYQSGSINESLSDLWGEYYDQTNGLGTDTNAVRWLIGEDVTGQGAQRSMKNPPQFGDPDKMTSTLYNKKTYFSDSFDNGGVHSNSGVNNKAVYLMVDGGTFNAKTVTALGWEKVAAIYYDAQTNLLTSGSDYSDLYYAAQQACSNLLGQYGISSADCLEVKDALDAVQMSRQPAANFTPEAVACPTGMTTNTTVRLFHDDFESGTGKWETSAWQLANFYATSGTHMMWGDDEPTRTDSSLTMKNPVVLPAGATSFLHFKHAFVFDHYNAQYYDGGVLEYSTNDGATWMDAKLLFSAGQNYKGTVFKYPAAYQEYGSALQGRSAFVGDSRGYVSSRYNLTSLAGKAVLFRWRFATDWITDFRGWKLDDVSIYKCVGTPSVPSLLAPANGVLLKDYTPLLDWANATSIDHYELQVATNSTFTSLVYNESNVPTSQFEVPADLDSNTKYYWRVRGVNGIGQTGKWTAARTFRTLVERPALVSPATNFTSIELRPRFDWEAPTGPGVISGYTIQISKNSAFTQLVHTGNPVGSEYVPTVDLPKNTPLFWRVLAKGANGPSLYSEIRTLTTPVNPPPTPILVSPANNGVFTTYTNLILKWKPVTFLDASFQHYQVQLADNLGFSEPLVDDITVTSRLTAQLTTSVTLTPNTKYYWRVRAVNTENEVSNWSAVWTIRAAILPPTLLTPSDDATGVDRKPLLDWDDVDGNTGYVLQIWKAGAKPTLVKTVTLPPNVSQYTFVTLLLPNTNYFWKVQTKSSIAPSAWSQADFKTGP